MAKKQYAFEIESLNTTHKLTDASSAKGGYFVIDAIANIPSDWYDATNGVITEGSFCYVTSASTTSKFYRYSGSGTSAGWVNVEFGGGGGGGMSNPMTTANDIIVGGTSGTPTRLAAGTTGQVLKVGSSGLEWSYVDDVIELERVVNIDYETIPLITKSNLEAIDTISDLNALLGTSMAGSSAGNANFLAFIFQEYETIPVFYDAYLNMVTFSYYSDSSVTVGTAYKELETGKIYLHNNVSYKVNSSSTLRPSNTTTTNSNELVRIDQGLSNPMTSKGDLIIGGVDGTPSRLGIGTNGQVLTSNGTTASWQTPSSGGGSIPYTEVSGTSQTLSPNTYYDFGSRDGGSITVTLDTPTSGILNEYMFEVVADENNLTVNTPSNIVWKDNSKVTNSNNTLTLSGKGLYQFSIVNNRGIIANFDNPALAVPLVTLSGSTLSWNAVANAEKYQVTTAGTARPEQTSTSFDLSQYYYSKGTLSTPALICGSPSVGTTSSNITLTFDTVTNATSYTLTKGGYSSGTTTHTSSPITVSSLVNGQTYTFKLKATNNATVASTVKAKAGYYNDSTSTSVNYSYAEYTASADSGQISVTIPYSISTSALSGGTISGHTNGILPNGTATVWINPASGYTYPSSITVNNATYLYDPSTGKISLSNPTNNVKLAITCPTA